MAAAAFRFCAGYGIGVWSAPYFRGAFPGFEAQYAIINACVVAGGGVASSLLGGYLSDRFAAKDPRVRAWVPMAGSLLAIPCWMGAVSEIGGFYEAMAFLLVEYVVAECWFGPTVTILQGAVPPDVRGTAQGAFSTLTAFGNVAPVVFGALTSQGAPLRDVLFWGVSLCYAASAVAFFATGQSLLADDVNTRKMV
ncbi:unnamed protein product [Phaeothamnion confervicola]